MLTCILKDGEVQIHRSLAKQCLGLEAMCQTQVQENTLTLTECTIDVFCKVRQLLSSHQFPEESVDLENFLAWNQVASFCDMYLWPKGQEMVLEKIVHWLDGQTCVASCISLLFPFRLPCAHVWTFLMQRAKSDLTRYLAFGKLNMNDDLLGCYDTLSPGQTFGTYGRAPHHLYSFCCKHSFPMWRDRKFRLDVPEGLQKTQFSASIYATSDTSHPCCWNFTQDSKTHPSSCFTRYCCTHRRKNEANEAFCKELIAFNTNRRQHFRDIHHQVAPYFSLENAEKIEVFDALKVHEK